MMRIGECEGSVKFEGVTRLGRNQLVLWDLWITVYSHIRHGLKLLQDVMLCNTKGE